MKDQVAIFGDCHGESKMLEDLLGFIKSEAPDAEIYSCGDLIDRGPDSSGVLDLCVQFGVKGVLGNHELWLRDLVEKRVFDSFALEPIMGGEATFLSYGITNFKHPSQAALDLLAIIPQTHKDFLMSLRAYRMVEVEDHKYWIIHAGLANSAARCFSPIKGNELSNEDMMKSIAASGLAPRYIMWPSPPLGDKFRPQHDMFKFKDGTQVLGHKPLNEPRLTESFIALDTGCGTCAPNKLTAILLPSKRIIQVENKWI